MSFLLVSWPHPNFIEKKKKDVLQIPKELEKNKWKL